MSVTSFTETGRYPQEYLAKKLNNRASLLLSTGNYEDSISLLRTALTLAEQSSNLSENKYKQPCSCKSCSLETSLSTDHDDSFVTMMMSDHEQEDHHHTIEKRNQKKNESSADDTVLMDYDEHTTANETADATLPPLHRQTSATTQRCHDSSSSNYFSRTKENGLVYSRPLLVNKRCLEDRHFMGVTLSLIILFNLALAHHLLAITEVAQHDKTGTNSPLQQALRIYKFAYGLYQDYKDQPVSSPQQPLSCPDHNNSHNDEEGSSTEDSNRAAGNLKLTMIVSNNIGEIHRMAGDPSKHHRSLQQLLSLMMFVVDDRCNLVVLDASEMNGFYHNLMPFILDDVCAQAA